MSNRTALICEKYLLPVIPGEAATIKGEGRALGYYEYINERTKETGKNLLCVEHLLSKFPKGLTVYEPFGGVGAFAALVQGLLRPASHTIGEIDADCLAQLRYVFGNTKGVRVEDVNARDALGTEPADIYLCDFPFHTIIRYQEWKEEWKRMTSMKPQAIVWMDGAISKLHLHTENYTKATGRLVTREPISYARAMSEILYVDTGYHITAAAYSWGCFYFLAELGPYDDDITITRYGEGTGERGFQWL